MGVLALAMLCVIEASTAGNLPSLPVRTPRDWLQWKSLPPLPDKLGVAGAFVGVSNGALIVAGGSNFPGSRWESGEKTYRATIFVLESNADSWRAAGDLQYPVAYGAAVSVGNRLICLGGRNATQVFDRAFALTWNAQSQRIETQSLPPLPQPCFELSAAAIGPTVYVAAGRDDAGPVHRCWRMPLASRSGEPSAWEELPPYPAPARFGAAMVAQSDGDQPCLYLIGGKHKQDYLTRVDRYDPRDIDPTSAWRPCADLPRPAYLAAAAPWGQSHLLVFSGSTGEHLDRLDELKERYRFPRDVLAYHTITDTWVHAADLPQGLAATSAVKWNGGLAIPGGEISPGLRTPDCLRATAVRTDSNFGALDYLAVFGYLATVTAVGLYWSGKNRGTTDFFLGGRQIPWWAAGLSLLATQVSSIGVVAIPAKSYATDWAYLSGAAAWLVVVPIVTSFFIPFFRRLEVTSAYEYLEARFSPTLRIFGSLVYCLLQLGRMAVVLYLPALALSSVTGIDVIPAVLVMGALCTLYTVAGGMRAVIWTEVLQAGVLVGGMLLCFAVVVWQIGGVPTKLFAVAHAYHKFQTVHVGWDALHSTLWVVFIGNVFIRLSSLTSDQAVVQRYLVTRDQRQSKMALWTDVAVSLPWALLVFSLGTALFVFYRENPQLLNPVVDVDGIVPFFVAQQLPAGISGLVVAAIMAAAMSTMESSMHSIATLLVTDFYCRLFPAATDNTRLWAARSTAVLVGGFGTASAVLLALANIQSLWDFFQYLMGLFVGSLTGLFLLGMFTTRANSRGALFGALASAAVMAYVTQYTQIHFLLYSAVGVLSCFSIGYLASLLIGGRHETTGLTAFTIVSHD